MTNSLFLSILVIPSPNQIELVHFWELKNLQLQYVESLQLKGNIDNFIHCIWYCITGTRFEDVEEETLKTLSEICDDAKLPIIIGYTQSIIQDIVME